MIIFRKEKESLELLNDWCPSDINWFETIEAHTPWQHNRIRVYGQWFDEPRLTQWFGPEYRYSTIHWPAQHVPIWLQPLFERVCETCQFEFNAVLLNYYRNGFDSMGWHSDNEQEMNGECIASLSLGQQRLIHFRHRTSKDKWSVQLPSHSLLIMRNFQENWQHAIPKSKKEMTGRINLTFRQIH